MYKLSEVQANIAELQKKQEAIVALAKDEDRELSAQDLTDLDDIEKDIDSAQALADRLEKIENRAAKLAEVKPAKTKPKLAPQQNKVIVPVNEIRRSSDLRAYDSAEAAYRSGRWLAAALYGHQDSIRWCQDYGLDPRNALSSGDNNKGGVLVPAELERAVIDLKEERGIFAREARQIAMMSDTKSVPRRTGGVTAYFIGENKEITSSDKNWDDVNLVARKLGAIVKYSSEVNEDAFISLAGDLAAEIAYAFADKEDECGFNGDGTSTYGGINGMLNAAAAGSVYTAATGNTAFSTLDLEDFEGVVGKLPLYAQQNAKWYISKAGYWASAANLANANGGNTVEHSASGPSVTRFMGYEVVMSQVLNSTLTAQTSTNLAVFGDIRQSAMYGARRGLEIMVSSDRYFELDQLAIKGTIRFDINVHEVGDATNAGSYIVLATPAS